MPMSGEETDSIVDPKELRAKVATIQWWHSMDLGHGVRTAGQNDPTKRLAFLDLPEDLSGMTVLDVGAWDGFYSFEAERRGAKRVLATDSYCWSGTGWGTKAGFNLAHAALGSRVESLQIDVLDLSPQTVGVFDLVLFLGVLYHMRHPLLALERLFSVTGKQAMIETRVDLMEVARPALAFFPGKELDDDPTNWWCPNALGMQAMLEAVGFREAKALPQQPSQKPRMVFHAWR